MLTAEDLHEITGNTSYADRKAGFLARIAAYAPDLATPHRMAMLLSQVLHESAGMKYVREIWGPTAAQRGYEGRADLGNTETGDGFRFLGRDLIQCTGRANYRSCTAWVRKAIDAGGPDFEAEPNLLEEPEWLGTSVIWYWTTRVPAAYVDAGNIEMVTRRVNGGLNGYADRLQWYDRAALVLLGYDAESVRQFQRDAGISVDGISGPVTRKAMHEALLASEIATPVRGDRLIADPSSDDVDRLRAALLSIRNIADAELA